MAPSSSPSDQFVRQLTEHQPQLMGFILASLGSYANAADVLQETNVVLWQKSEELRNVDEFMPWALAIARFKVLSFVRDRQRERLVFSPEVSEALSTVALSTVERIPERLDALRECLAQLPESKLVVLRQRYAHDMSLSQIAAESATPIGTVKNRLKRIRGLLSDCVNRRIGGSKQLAR